MGKLLELLSLKPIQGERTQLTIIVAGVINILNELNVVKITPDQMTTINQVLLFVGAYFFSEKVSKVAK